MPDIEKLFVPTIAFKSKGAYFTLHMNSSQGRRVVSLIHP